TTTASLLPASSVAVSAPTCCAYDSSVMPPPPLHDANTHAASMTTAHPHRACQPAGTPPRLDRAALTVERRHDATDQSVTAAAIRRPPSEGRPPPAASRIPGPRRPDTAGPPACPNPGP